MRFAPMTAPRPLSWLVLLAAILFVVAPFFFSFAGFETGDFPNPQPDPAIQPPGWAFSIWGLIYSWLLVCAVAGATIRRGDPDWARHRAPFLVALAIGAAWLPVSQISPVLATAMIWTMLLAAAAALVRTPERDRWLLRVPVGLFAGWLTAASSVSLAIVGPGYEVAFSIRTWTYVAVFAALFVAAVVHLALGNVPEYALPIVWGFGSITYGAYPEDSFVAGLATAATLAVIALMIWAPELRAAFSVEEDRDDAL